MININQPLPCRVKILGYVFNIELVEGFDDADTTGMIKFKEQKICIKKSLALPVAWATLMHEVTHQILDFFYLNRTLDEPEVELVCNAIGNSISQISFEYEEDKRAAPWRMKNCKG